MSAAIPSTLPAAREWAAYAAAREAFETAPTAERLEHVLQAWDAWAGSFLADPNDTAIRRACRAAVETALARQLARHAEAA